MMTMLTTMMPMMLPPMMMMTMTMMVMTMMVMKLNPCGRGRPREEAVVTAPETRSDSTLRGAL